MKQPAPRPTVHVAGDQAMKRPDERQPAQRQHPAIRSAARPETVPPARVAPAPKTGAATTFRGSPERLIAVLTKTVPLYRQLLAASRDRRAALRTADFAGFSKIDASEKRIIAEIAELDHERLGEARAIAAKLGLPADASLAEIGEKLPPDVGGRLIALREELRGLVIDVRRESSVVRQAAERLSAHIAGIVQTVHAAIAQANVYSSGGRIATGGGVISSLDIRS